MPAFLGWIQAGRVPTGEEGTQKDYSRYAEVRNGAWRKHYVRISPYALSGTSAKTSEMASEPAGRGMIPYRSWRGIPPRFFVAESKLRAIGRVRPQKKSAEALYV
jgi:hypothetical protein